MPDSRPQARSQGHGIGGTVRGRAADELRNRILTGRLQAGTRVDLDAITAEFGISRTPVREALLELSYEGLVTVAPRSGITVVGVTPEDAVDNFAVLAALAGKAAEWATVRMTPAELAELRNLAGAVEAAIDATGGPEAGGDAAAVVAANRRFHRAVNRAARSPRLLTFMRHAVRMVPTNYFELFPEQEETSRKDHAALLDALARRDAPAARSIAEAHILDAGEALGDWLRTQAAEQAS